jgi:ethanolamine-phosphate cytidylyltransferase
VFHTLASTRRIAEFSKPHRAPTPADTVVYIDGAFDLFHIGHATTLRKAKELGTFLIVGIHDDDALRRHTDQRIQNSGQHG